MTFSNSYITDLLVNLGLEAGEKHLKTKLDEKRLKNNLKKFYRT